MNRTVFLKAMGTNTWHFLRTWGTLSVAILALGTSVYAVYLDHEHFKESTELQEKAYERSSKLALTALELERKHYEELTKPHTRHEEVYDKLVLLNERIQTARESINSVENLSETPRKALGDMEESLSKAGRLSSEAERAWVSKEYDEADRLISEAFTYLARIPSVVTGTIDVFGILISDEGVILYPLTLTATDGVVTLIIPKYTIALTKLGTQLSSMSIILSEKKPATQPGYTIVGSVYDMEPEGATFDPPITLAIRYDENAVPEGAAEEDLVIAYWNGAEWVVLEGVNVVPEKNIVSALVGHFNPVAIIALVKPVPVVNWWLIGAIIVGVIIVALMMMFLARRYSTA